MRILSCPGLIRTVRQGQLLTVLAAVSALLLFVVLMNAAA
jgi:hypothetical protein